MKRFSRFLEEMSAADLNSAEKDIDTIFRLKNLDVEFTRHFKNRILDQGEPGRFEYDDNQAARDTDVTKEELVRLFTSLFKQQGRLLAQQNRRDPGQFEVVLKDVTSKLNIPVVFTKRDGKNVVTIDCKTIMRKGNFATSTPTVSVRS